MRQHGCQPIVERGVQVTRCNGSSISIGNGITIGNGIDIDR